MRLYLMRHATAEDPAGVADAARRLTEQGRLEAREAGDALLRERNAALAAILSSPRIRARETADLVAAALGGKVPVDVRERLNCGASAAAFLEELRPFGDGDVLLVVHNPEVSAFASGLVGKPLSFRPSTICCIELEAGSARLEWMRHPAQRSHE